MKTVIILGGVLALALLAVPAVAHTEDNPFVTELLTGQDMDTSEMQSSGPTVTGGEPAAWTRAAGVRYKVQTGEYQNSEMVIYLGSDLDDGNKRVEVNGPWIEDAATPENLYFTFDQANNQIRAEVSGAWGSHGQQYDFDDLAPPGCDPADWNALEIIIRDSRTDGGVALEDVILWNGLGVFGLGDFGNVNVAGTPGFQYWTVTDFDFSKSFEMSAVIDAENFNGNEEMKIEFIVGCIDYNGGGVPVPEFPSVLIPSTGLIGFIFAVLFVQMRQK